MEPIVEGQLCFMFPEDWQVLKYDDSHFYRNHFQNFGHSKAVDIIAFSKDEEEIWFIEVKDYSDGKRDKEIGLYDEVALKVKDSLAGLAVLAHRKTLELEQNFAWQAIHKARQRIVFHLELPKNRRREDSKSLFPATKAKIDGIDKLKQLVRPVDIKPMICSVQAEKERPKVAWEVAWITKREEK